MAVIPDEYAFDAAAGTDGMIYLLNSSPESSWLIRFDPADRVASRLPPQPGSFRHLLAGGNGWFYLVGDSGVAAYDVPEAAWSVIGPPPPVDLLGAGVALGTDGRIYAVGGSLGGDDVTGFATAFDPNEGHWSDVDAPAVPRTRPEVVAGPDGRIYLIGGGVWGMVPTLERTVEAFDPIR